MSAKPRIVLDTNVNLDGDLELQGTATLDAVSQLRTLTLTGSGNQTLTGNLLLGCAERALFPNVSRSVPISPWIRTGLRDWA